jgi:hypothetical protein
MKNLSNQAVELLHEQERSWPLLAQNRTMLLKAKVRTFQFDGFSVRVQLNVGRLSFALRRPGSGECFLCDPNRPPEQKLIPCGGGFNLMCNPYPILPEHFTIIHERHAPQRILPALEAMLDLARAMGGRFMIFYNGPQCGASAPDHLHLQAGPMDSLPALSECPRVGKLVDEAADLRILAGAHYLRRFVLIETSNSDVMISRFQRLYESQRILQPDVPEPMMNILCSYEANRWRMIVFPRSRHRPNVYFAQEDRRLLLSPGALDVGGLIVLPVEEHFDRITADDIAQAFEDVTLERGAFERLIGEIVGFDETK